jgi:CBS domain-containing protein
MDTAADIMRSPVVRIGADATAAAALDLMRQAHVTCLLIEPTDPSEAYGFFSQTDAVERIVAAQVDPASVMVGSIMSRPVFTVPPQTSIVDCALLMHKARIHRVLVHDGTDIVGLVSASDILGFSRR